MLVFHRHFRMFEVLKAITLGGGVGAMSQNLSCACALLHITPAYSQPLGAFGTGFEPPNNYLKAFVYIERTESEWG